MKSQIPVKIFRIFWPSDIIRKFFSEIFAIISSAGKVFLWISRSTALSYILRRKHTFIPQLICRLRRFSFLANNFERRLPKTISVNAQVILEEECARSGELDVL